MRDSPVIRPDTWDAGIWATVPGDYPTLPPAFAPGEIVVDVGCHTGGFCVLAAQRGATVIGYEANRDNHALAAINTARFPNVAIRFGAVWRSDDPAPGERRFTPSAVGVNTGGGSVLFDSVDDHWAALPGDGPPAGTPVLASHPVPTVPLDHVLESCGRVRFLKLDVEGAEFPILLTSRRLDLVDAVAGEYHALDAAAWNRLAPDARVGGGSYDAALLRRTLEAAGFTVTLRPGDDGRLGLFSAEREAAGRS